MTEKERLFKDSAKSAAEQIYNRFINDRIIGDYIVAKDHAKMYPPEPDKPDRSGIISEIMKTVSIAMREAIQIENVSQEKLIDKLREELEDIEQSRGNMPTLDSDGVQQTL